jgi:hypothetical protein
VTKEKSFITLTPDEQVSGLVAGDDPLRRRIDLDRKDPEKGSGLDEDPVFAVTKLSTNLLRSFGNYFIRKKIRTRRLSF